MIRRWLNSRWFLAVLTLLVLGIGLSVAAAQWQLNTTRTEERNTRRRLATLKDSVSSDMSGDDLREASGDYIIIEAKRRLDYKDPAENVVLVIRNNTESSVNDSVDLSASKSSRDESRLLQWWKYMIGR